MRRAPPHKPHAIPTRAGLEYWLQRNRTWLGISGTGKAPSAEMDAWDRLPPNPYWPRAAIPATYVADRGYERTSYSELYRQMLSLVMTYNAVIPRKVVRLTCRYGVTNCPICRLLRGGRP